MSHPHPLPPLYLLPREIILLITDYLSPEASIALTLATYPLFQRRGLAPHMCSSRLAIITGTSLTDTSLTTAPRRPSFPMMILPTELLLQIMRRLPRADMMAFVVADYPHLEDMGIAPRVTESVVEFLRLACPR